MAKVVLEYVRAAKYLCGSDHDDFKIQSYSPAVHIPKIKLNSAAHVIYFRRLTTRAVDLGPACDTWLYILALPILRN